MRGSSWSGTDRKRQRGARAIRKRWHEAQGLGGKRRGTENGRNIAIGESRADMANRAARFQKGLPSVGNRSCRCPDGVVVNGVVYFV